MAALYAPGSPLGSAAEADKGIFIYRTEKGDTLSSIAQSFGISLDTVIQANPKVKSSSLQIGQEIVILPVSGVVHVVRAGDTLQAIASRYGVGMAKIKEFNSTIVNPSDLDEGARIIIPGGNPKDKPREAGVAATLASASAALTAYFIQPAEGFNWGILHGTNGVDIANSCKTPVVAAAEGLVIPDGGACEPTDEWNGGYGTCLTIQHPNGVKTKYAHLNDVSAELGDYVRQGEAIGRMGDTGKATGCHLHFEVRGAANPFARY